MAIATRALRKVSMTNNITKTEPVVTAGFLLERGFTEATEANHNDVEPGAQAFTIKSDGEVAGGIAKEIKGLAGIRLLYLEGTGNLIWQADTGRRAFFLNPPKPKPSTDPADYELLTALLLERGNDGDEKIIGMVGAAGGRHFFTSIGGAQLDDVVNVLGVVPREVIPLFAIERHFPLGGVPPLITDALLDPSEGLIARKGEVPNDGKKIGDEVSREFARTHLNYVFEDRAGDLIVGDGVAPSLEEKLRAQRRRGKSLYRVGLAEHPITLISRDRAGYFSN